ncbi:MAG: radical SAM protein [Oscillospiraceae bacterium]|nr:radical SAM protein [Oscillospiraceae bacterium]
MLIFERTESVCPVCLKKLSAYLAEKPKGIFLQKTCQVHGRYSTWVWEGDRTSYLAWETGNKKKDSIPGGRAPEKGCPYDCGLCTEHVREGCCVLLEVTHRCNLHCPVCFASAGERVEADPTQEKLGQLMDLLMERGGPFNLQLSGGEPTVRDDLPEILALAKSKGFHYFQLNTNGIRLAEEKGYAEKLKMAGLSSVFLQFDTLSDKVNRVLRGRPLLMKKLAAIRACERAGLGVVLVPVIVPGLNDNEIGDLLRFAQKSMPTVRGVHFQPISYFGRCLPPEDRRITIPFMLRAIQKQSHGRMKASDFKGGGAENPYCSFKASYLVKADGKLQLLKAENGCCCGTTSQKSRESVARQWTGAGKNKAEPGTMDALIQDTLNHTLAISGMLFQDCYNLDLNRLKRCYILEADERYGMVPFCAYNLTDSGGESLYR